MDATADSAPPPPGGLYRLYKTVSNRHQYYLDKATPHLTVRWVVSVLLVLFYCIRVYFLQGWYIVTYALGIYLLNLFIAFLTPKIDPAGFDDSDADDGPSLPTRNNEEFRPFMRRLPEFKFWYSFTKAIVVAMVCTFFEALNIPVFWPILVMYFIILFTLTMKRQIKHMIKYRYLPFSHGKARYKGKEDTGKVVSS
ncbi:protein RER1 [Aplysia californica]|uniref:Protein RER1 n=1 Tax=Aplysia californica TaxID=6500 RepID=A0ABM1A8Y4_APLCA|nr:protein RER1 [Aplysia californica]